MEAKPDEVQNMTHLVPGLTHPGSSGVDEVGDVLARRVVVHL